MATFEQIPSNRTLDYRPETIKTSILFILLFYIFILNFKYRIDTWNN